MTNSIIIDEYHRRPLLDRIISESATTFIWGGWAWLCRFHHFFNFRFLMAAIPPAVEEPAVALISTSSALVLWGSVDTDKPDYKELQTADYAEHFGLTEKELTQARNSKICTVYHDEYGNITNIN